MPRAARSVTTDVNMGYIRPGGVPDARPRRKCQANQAGGPKTPERAESRERRMGRAIFQRESRTEGCETRQFVAPGSRTGGRPSAYYVTGWKTCRLVGRPGFPASRLGTLLTT